MEDINTGSGGVNVAPLIFGVWIGKRSGPGAVKWLVERDDFALPNQLSSVRAVAVSADRALATGTWISCLLARVQ